MGPSGPDHVCRHALPEPDACHVQRKHRLQPSAVPRINALDAHNARKEAVLFASTCRVSQRALLCMLSMLAQHGAVLPLQCGLAS